MGQLLLGHASTDSGEFANNVKIQDYYNKSWHAAFRAIDPNVANKLADCMIKACNNNVIGYNQGARYTLWYQIEDKGFDPSKATSKCYTDCSQLISVCCSYAGVPISRLNTTGVEEGNLLGTKQFQKISVDPNSFQRGDILLSSGHTAMIVSTNGEAGLSEFSVSYASYEFKKYTNLTDSQIRKIASLCKQEQDSLEGAKAEASLAANILETHREYSKFGDDIYKFIRTGRWFANAAKYMDLENAPAKIVEGVKDVLVNGNRTLPLFVDEHDCFSDITSAKNNGEEIRKSDREAYIRDTTIIKNTYGSTYKFWCFPDKNSDPFGYTNEVLRREWEKYLNPQAVTSQAAAFRLDVDYTKLSPYILYVDRHTTRKLDYADLMSNHGVTGVMIEGGSGFEINGFRNPRCYRQAEAAMEAGCPFGYVLDSTASTTKQANQETEMMRFLVSHYSPSLGVWVSLVKHRSKTLNDKILKIYEREFKKFGLKDKIGIRCTRDQLKNEFTWKNYQENWYLWLVDYVDSTSNLQALLDPKFFDTDGSSGPVRGVYGGGMLGGTGVSASWGGGTSGPDIETIAKVTFAILTTFGIPEINVCGLMGCYTGENSMDVTTIEADYKFFPNQQYQWTEGKQQAMDDFDNYTKKAMAYHHTNNPFYYCKEDGHWYAGIGMTSATGVIAYRLLQYAKKAGVNWYTVECQCAYLLADYKDGGFSANNWLKTWTKPAASIDQAVNIYFGHYEMPGKTPATHAGGRRANDYYGGGKRWWGSIDMLRAAKAQYQQIADAVVAYVRGGSSGSMNVQMGSSSVGGPLSAAQQKVVTKATDGSVPFTHNNLCLKWVGDVWQAAGYPFPRLGAAINVWQNWGSKYGSTDLSNIPAGSLVVGSGVGSAGAKYGHVGIALGDYKNDGKQYVVSDSYNGVETIESFGSWQKANCHGYVGNIGWVWPDGKDLRNMS